MFVGVAPNAAGSSRSESATERKRNIVSLVLCAFACTYSESKTFARVGGVPPSPGPVLSPPQAAVTAMIVTAATNARRGANCMCEVLRRIESLRDTTRAR